MKEDIKNLLDVVNIMLEDCELNSWLKNGTVAHSFDRGSKQAFDLVKDSLERILKRYENTLA